MDTTKDTTMQHVTDAAIAVIKRIAEHPLKAPVIVRANVMLGVIMCLEEAEKECDELRVEFIAGLLERIEQLESGPATAEQDSRQKQARIEILEEGECKQAALLDCLTEWKSLAKSAEKERDNYKFALSAYTEKTEWVQLGITNGTVSPKYLGWHRADVMTDLLEAAEKERDAAELMSLALQAKVEAMEKQEPIVEVRWAADIPNGFLVFTLVNGYLPKLGDKFYALPGAQPAPSGVQKVVRGFRWDSEAQHHIPTLEVEFTPVPSGFANDSKGWQERDRLAKMLGFNERGE